MFSVQAIPAISKRLVAALGRVPLLRDLPLATLQALAAVTQELQLVKDQQLFRGGRRPHGLFHVLDGQMKLAITNDVGDEKTIEIYSAGDSFGLADVFATYGAQSFAQATARTELLLVGKEGLLAALDGDPLLARRLLTWLADRSCGLERDIAAYCIHSARRRVMDFFLRQAGIDADALDKAVVTLDMRKRLIAARLSLTPETFSRALRDLSAAGLIAVHGRQVTLLPPLLALHREATVTSVSDRLVPQVHRRRHADAAAGADGATLAVRSSALEY